MKRVTLLGFVFIISLAVAFLNPFQAIQWKISDSFFRPSPIRSEITLVAIDDASLSPETGLGRFSDWPRGYYAAALQQIARYRPAVIGLDLDFREVSRGLSRERIAQLLTAYEKQGKEPGVVFDWYQLLRSIETKHPDDKELQKVLNESGPVVLFTSFVQTGDAVAVQLPIFSGSSITTGLGVARLDRDGVLREFLPRSGEYVHFSAALVREYLKKQGTEFNSDTLREQSERIAFSGVPNSYQTVSFADVLAGRFDTALFEGKIVILGATAPIINDRQNTPTSRNPMAGPEILANITQQLLEGRSVSEQGAFSLIVVLALLVFGGGYLLFVLGLRALLIVALVLFVGYPLTAFALYQKDFVVNVVYPEFTLLLTVGMVLWYRNKTELREKRRIKKAFSHYVSPVIVNELVKKPELLRLGGVRHQISVLFSDIVGFTTLSEKLSPEDTVAVLNDYLSAMTDVIFQFHGTLDKYQGDAIMALFGAPLDDPHHAVNACHTSLGMRKALKTLQERWQSIPQLPFKEELVHLDFRVGIATGPAVIGNVGSSSRFDYTAIGDIVNLGSRLESVNRKYGTQVLVDKGTFAVITANHNPFVFRKLDVVRVKGKRTETEVFEVTGYGENCTDELRAVLDDFENGRIQYNQRNFLQAKEIFQSVIDRLPSDGPAQIYRNRCDFYIRKPPSRDWSPVVNLEEK